VSNSDRLVVTDLSAAWDGVPVVQNVNLSVRGSEIVVLMGPNGSGKTTLLRAIVGLEPLTSGSVSLDGRRVDQVPTHRRGIGMLFQDPALFPHRSVFENIAYGVELERRSDAEVDSRVRDLADVLQITHLLDRKPDTLSGGEQQRVALARTLAPRPAVVLLDEPFASVDPELKGELAAEFRAVLTRLGTSAIFVTHDRAEGLFLGDRVLLLFHGKVVQEGLPESVYRAPIDPQVARFLGYNVVRGDKESFAIHPRAITLNSGSMGATVVASGAAGDERVVYFETENGSRLEARMPISTRPYRTGERVMLGWSETIRYPVGSKD